MYLIVNSSKKGFLLLIKVSNPFLLYYRQLAVIDFLEERRPIGVPS